MKKVTSLISHRLLSGDASWKIVFEWEDIISNMLKIPVRTVSAFTMRYFYRSCDILHLHFLPNLFASNNELSLYYITITSPVKDSFLTKSVIPVIIDFWLKDSEIDDFFLKCRNVPLILCTNKEVSDKLKSKKCPIPVEHWGLSCPDQYAMKQEVNYTKKYEFCIFGRPNPFFVRYLEKYCESHSDFSYIVNQGDINNRQYITNKGVFVSKDTGRQSYIEMIRNTKISCYTTPGVDESKKGANGYNQVTPRVFEMLCNGCHVIGHYPPSSADVLWYSLDQIVPNIDTYEEFELYVNMMRNTDFDIKKMKNFMQKHYTSSRCMELKSILNRHNILI